MSKSIGIIYSLWEVDSWRFPADSCKNSFPIKPGDYNIETAALPNGDAETQKSCRKGQLEQENKLMKKILAWMLCAVMLASLAACGDTAPDSNASKDQNVTGGSAGKPATTPKPTGNGATPRPAENGATPAPAEGGATPKPQEAEATPEPAGTDDASQDTSAEDNSISDFISGMELIKIPEIDYTQWMFTGVYENGKELSADEVEKIKTEHTYITFLFPDSTALAILEQNGYAARGEYSAHGDGYALDMTLDDNGTQLSYTAMFKQGEKEPVMMLFWDKSAKTVWCFTLMTDVG